MKYLFFVILSLVFVVPTFAAVIPVSSTSQIPAGYSFISPTGLYENGSDTKYQVTTSSPASSSSTASPSSPSPTVWSSVDAGENILWLTQDQLRSGNVDMNTIPQVILSVIQTLLGIAGTVAIFSLIYHAVQMQLNSGITGDSSGVDKAKKGMTGALVGFVIAIAAWFLVTRAVDLLSAVS